MQAKLAKLRTELQEGPKKVRRSALEPENAVLHRAHTAQSLRKT
jgi:hypothetical protein